MNPSEQDSTRTSQMKKLAGGAVTRVVAGFLALLVVVAVLSIVFVWVDVVMMAFERAGIPGWQAAIISVGGMFLCYILGGFVKAVIEV